MQYQAVAIEPVKNLIDLCTTCQAAPDCTSPMRNRRPVLECDWFTAANGGHTSRTHTAKTRKDCVKSPHLIRLCDDCENRDSCDLPKGGTGTWYCQEYQ